MRTRLALAAALVAVASLGPVPATAAEDAFVLTGRGNGHGIGMSQWGAQAQALEGRTHQQILSTYYAGTSLTTRAAPYTPRIGVLLDRHRTQLVPVGGTVRVDIGSLSFDSVPGEVWEVVTLQTGRCRITHPDGVTTTEWAGNGMRCLVAAPTTGARVEVRRPSAGAMVRHHTYGRSSVVEVFRDLVGETWRVDVVVETPLEEYLLGLAEVPTSWEPAAQEAQAIAARSYAMHRLLAIGDPDPDRGCRCHLYDSQQDQVWAGADREAQPGWANWRDAVQDTAQVVVHAPGAPGTRDGVVQAFYSSSSNGRTEAKHELWGGAALPYLTSVADPWSRTSLNPHRTWQAAVPVTTVAAALGLDRVDRISVRERSTSSAATVVRFEGTDGGSPITVERTGAWTRTALGLRSTTIDAVFLPPFTDDDGNPHEADIAWIAARQITRGCNPPANDRFCPGGTVTRGQMAAFLTRALDLPDGPARFTDTAGSVFASEIDALARARITLGCNPPTNDRYCPEGRVTRAQMASFLARAMDLPAGDPGRFRDVGPDDTHARAIAALADAGITRGCNPPANDRYCPDAAITRAQMATFLHRALDLD